MLSLESMGGAVEKKKDFVKAQVGRGGELPSAPLAMGGCLWKGLDHRGTLLPCEYGTEQGKGRRTREGGKLIKGTYLLEVREDSSALTEAV